MNRYELAACGHCGDVRLARELAPCALVPEHALCAQCAADVELLLARCQPPERRRARRRNEVVA